MTLRGISAALAPRLAIIPSGYSRLRVGLLGTALLSRPAEHTDQIAKANERGAPAVHPTACSISTCRRTLTFRLPTQLSL